MDIYNMYIKITYFVLNTIELNLIFLSNERDLSISISIRI